MKAIIVLIILIPTLCFSSTNLIYDQAIKSKAEPKLSVASKTFIEFSLNGLTTKAVTLNGGKFIKTLPLIDEVAEFCFTGEEGLPDLPEGGLRLRIILKKYFALSSSFVCLTRRMN